MSEKSRNRDTLDTYRQLLELEVRSLVNRVTEITNTVGALFLEVNDITLKIEEHFNKLEQEGSDKSRSELTAVKRVLNAHTKQVVSIRESLAELVEKVETLTKDSGPKPPPTKSVVSG